MSMSYSSVLYQVITY